MTDFDVMRHLTEREGTRRPQRIAYPTPLSFPDFRTLAAKESSLVTYFLTPQVFEVFITPPRQTFQLYTFRHKPRRFKSADTAVRFARALGIPHVLWDGLAPKNPRRRLSTERRASNGTS